MFIFYKNGVYFLTEKRLIQLLMEIIELINKVQNRPRTVFDIQ